MRLVVMVVWLCACGRIGFDPSGGDMAGGDGGGGSDAIVGGAGESCASAGILVIGQPLTGQSVAGATNDVMVGSCPGGVDVVYAVSSATSGMRMFVIEADFAGSLITSNACPPSNVNCTGFSAGTPQPSITAIPVGTTYVIVEKSTGTGTTFSLRLD